MNGEAPADRVGVPSVASRDHALGLTRSRRRFVIFVRLTLRPVDTHNSGGRARGSRSLEPAVLGTVTKGPPSRGVTLVKATSGISLGSPSSGKSFRSGKNG